MRLVGEILDHDLIVEAASTPRSPFPTAELASRPRCDNGSAAMKITSSTSSTSIIGVMFMSDDGAKHGGLDHGAHRDSVNAR